MKKLLLLLFVLSAVTYGQSNVFERHYGGTRNDRAEAIQQTKDGGYIVGGSTESFGAGASDMWLVKVDAKGEKEWDKTYGGVANELGFDVKQTKDGGYIFIGCTETASNGGMDIYLVKTDAVGNKKWDCKYGGGRDDVGHSVVETNDGYLIAGYTRSKGDAYCYVYLLKIDLNGVVRWEKTVGGGDDACGNYIEKTKDGGFVIIGFTKNLSAGLDDIYLIKLDAGGNVSWEKIFGAGDEDKGFCVRQTPDGGYIVSGLTRNNGAGYSDFYLAKLDDIGNKMWEKRYGENGNEAGNSVWRTPDSGYIVAGYTGSRGGYTDVYLVKTDYKGNKLWDKTFGGALEDWGGGLEITKDGGFVICGYTKSFTFGGEDFYIIKTDSKGETK
jgi:hypothetical protein